MSAGIRRCHYKEQCSAFLKSLGIDEAYLPTPCNTKPSTSSPAAKNGWKERFLGQGCKEMVAIGWKTLGRLVTNFVDQGASAGAEKPKGDFSSELKSNGQLTRPRLSREQAFTALAES